MKVKFNVESYVASHGRAPRGTGRWLFDMVGSNERGASTAFEMFSVYGSYTEAKRAARERARVEAAAVGDVKVVYAVVLP